MLDASSAKTLLEGVTRVWVHYGSVKKYFFAFPNENFPRESFNRVARGTAASSQRVFEEAISFPQTEKRRSIPSQTQCRQRSWLS